MGPRALVRSNQGLPNWLAKTIIEARVI